MMRCKRCILPKTYPGIKLDDKGICSFCSTHETPDWNAKKEQLNLVLDKAKRFPGRYQIIVPFSGGKDSAYVLYVLRKIYGLKTIAINFDNGFRSTAAEANLGAVTAALDVDLISLKPAWDLMRKLYRAFVMETGEFCTVCNAMGYLTILSFIMNNADRMGLNPLIAGGWARYLEAMPGVYSFDLAYFHGIISQAGLADDLLASGLIKETGLQLLMKAPDPRTINTSTVSAGEGIPFAYLSLPEYIYWDLKDITGTLKTEAGWASPADSENDTHFDCIMYPVAQYFERKKYGFSQNTITYSSLIRHGQMTREEALAKIKKTTGEEPKEYRLFLERIGLSDQDVNWKGLWHPQRGKETIITA